MNLKTEGRDCSGSGRLIQRKRISHKKGPKSPASGLSGQWGAGKSALVCPNVMTQIPQSAAFTAEVKLALAGDEDDGRTAAGDGDMAVLGMTGHHYAFGGLEREKTKFGCAFTRAS